MPATDVARRQQPRRACKRAATEVETAAAETAESYEMSPSPPKKPVVVAPPPMRVCVIGRYQNKVAASQVRTCDYPAMLQKQSMGCIPMLFEQDTEMLETRLPARQEGGRRASAATPKHGKSALASRQEAAVAAVELNRENYAIDTVYKMEGECHLPPLPHTHVRPACRSSPLPRPGMTVPRRPRRVPGAGGAANKVDHGRRQ